MRRPLIAGNWKMNLNRAEAVALATAVAEGSRAIEYADLAVFPPFVYLDAVRQAVNRWIREAGAFDAVVDFDVPAGAKVFAQRPHVILKSKNEHEESFA